MRIFAKPSQLNDKDDLHVYLAGPDVFKADAIKIGERKKNLLSAANCIGHYPIDNVITNFKRDKETAFRIAQANELVMNKCNVIFVNMTPWYGPSMEVGTAFETGYMSARANFDADDVLIVGYYEGEVELDFAKRVADQCYNGNVIHHADGSVTDPNGVRLESFGLQENLMLVAAINKTGGEIYTSFEEAVKKVHSLWAMKKWMKEYYQDVPQKYTK